MTASFKVTISSIFSPAFCTLLSAMKGVVTGALMVLSPTMFRMMGWKGVAAATPQILLIGGVGFFGMCMLYQYAFASAAAAASPAATGRFISVNRHVCSSDELN